MWGLCQQRGHGAAIREYRSRRFPQYAGNLELNGLAGGFHHFNGYVKPGAEGVDHLFYQHLRGRCTGSDADSSDAVQRAPVDIHRALHQLGVRAACCAANFDQPKRIAGIGCADHQKRVNPACNGFDRPLPIGGGIADVFFMRAGNGGKSSVQRRHYPRRIIHRQRGLGDIGKTRLVAHIQVRNIGFGFNQQNFARRQLAHGADGFGVALVADHHHLQASLKMPFRLDMHFADKRAGGIDKHHFAAERHFEAGLQMVMIGHKGHPETIGTMGQLPVGEVLLVETEADVAHLHVRDEARLAYITQTTLSVDDTAGIVAALHARFPAIIGPHKEDICYATTNRQGSVKAIAGKIDALLVIGAPNSSNSLRLVEVGRAAGCPYAQLVQRATDIDWRALDGIATVGITAGASAPEVLVNEVIDAFRTRFDVTVELVETAREAVEFKVPRVLRETA